MKSTQLIKLYIFFRKYTQNKQWIYTKRWLSNVHIKRLRLIDVNATISSHVNQRTLSLNELIFFDYFDGIKRWRERQTCLISHTVRYNICKSRGISGMPCTEPCRAMISFFNSGDQMSRFNTMIDEIINIFFRKMNSLVEKTLQSFNKCSLTTANSPANTRRV